MRTRTVLSTALAVWSLGLVAVGTARAERSLLGITVGRSYRTVLARYGNPDRTDAVFLPTGTAPQLAAQYGGVGGFGGQPGFPGAPGAGGDNSGAAGGFPGGPAGSPFGAPTSGGFPGAPGGFSGAGPGGPGGPAMGGPPVLPGAGAGGFPGGPGEAAGGPGGFPGAGGGFGGAAGGFGGQQQQPSVGNAAMWTYRRQGGVTMEFLINEDGLVAEISVSGRSFGTSTGKGIRLGSGYSALLNTYGFPDSHRIISIAQSGVQPAAMPYSSVVRSGGQVTQVTYSSKHNVAFTLLNNQVVRMTVALAE